MANLEYFNIKVDRSKETKDVVIKGEVSNRTEKSYSTIALRIIVFVKNISIANVVVLINGLPIGATKAFEKSVEAWNTTT